MKNVVHEYGFTVTSYDSDSAGELKFSSLLAHMQEAAWLHAETLGWGYQELRDKGVFWILSRMTAERFSPLKWGEAYTLHTWPRRPEGVFWFRDFRISNSKGDIVAVASSSWLIVDLKTRKINNLPLAGFLFPEDNVGLTPLRLKGFEKPDRETIVTPFFTDTDVNKHVNNTRYADWIMNHFYPFQEPEKNIRVLSLNYQAELNPGTKISIRSLSPSPLESAVEGKIVEDNTVIFKAFINWH